MKLQLERIYFPTTTVGMLKKQEELICYTLELPYRGNQPRVSCIAEGIYELKKRYSQRFGWHVEVCNVPNRHYILFHAGNDADISDNYSESLGCILPNLCVMMCTGKEIRGMQSSVALKQFESQVMPVLESGETVWLEITSYKQ